MIVDYIEAGKGEAVVVLYSTVSGNRQWKKLFDRLRDQYHIAALYLFGYGTTDMWSSDKPQTLTDQAELIHQLIPSDGKNFSLAGHSFGASVAMMAAKMFKKYS